MLLFVRVSQAGDAAEAVTAAAVPPPRRDEDGCHEGRSRAMRALTHVVALSRSGPPGGGADGLRQVCRVVRHESARRGSIGDSDPRARRVGAALRVWKPADIVVRIPFAPRGLAVGAQPSDGARRWEERLTRGQLGALPVGSGQAVASSGSTRR